MPPKKIEPAALFSKQLFKRMRMEQNREIFNNRDLSSSMLSLYKSQN